MRGSKHWKKKRQIVRSKIERGCPICHPEVALEWYGCKISDLKRTVAANDQLREAVENQELAA